MDMTQADRTESLAALLADLDRRGVQYDLIDGVFRFCDENAVLSESEKIGIDVIRPALTSHLRELRGLCLACAGIPRKATRPDYGPKLRGKYPPIWCEACDRAGAWKAGL